METIKMDKTLLRAIQGSAQLQEQKKAQRREILARWNKTGMLKGLNVKGNPRATMHRQLQMAQILENQIKGVAESKDSMLPGLLMESSPSNITSTGANKEAWSNVAFPLVRRVFAETFAEELVSIQAMEMPTSYIFYLDFKYATDKPDAFEQNSVAGLYSSSDSLYGNPTASNSPTGRWYGGADHSFTRNYVSASGIAGTAVTASWGDIEYDNDLSASLAAGQIQKVNIANNQFTASSVNSSASIDQQTPSAVLLVSGSGGVLAQYRRFSQFHSVPDSWSFIVSASAGFSGDSFNVEYLQTTSETTRGDFETNQTHVGVIPEVKIDIRRENVEASTRRLKTTWSEEDAQDIEAYQGISIEETFVDVMTKVMTQEIDLMILDDLRKAAIDVQYWSRKLANYVNKYDGTDIVGQPTFYGTQEEWYTTLFERIVDMSNLMHRRTHLGGATHLVVSPEVSTILESSGMRGGVGASGEPIVDRYSGGTADYIGTLKNQWQVFKSPYVPTNEILLVRRGSDWIDTGYVYAPYIPLTFTDTLVDPDNFSLVKGAMMRAARKVTKPEFFARIEVKHLNVA